MDSRGLGAAPCDHFGSAPFFTLVDTETDKVDVVPNTDQGHAEGECDPLRSLDTERIDLVICQGMGRRAMTLLSEAGIPFCITWKPNVAAMVAAHREGRLGDETRRRIDHGGDSKHTNCVG